jgi:hypothetical protein
MAARVKAKSKPKTKSSVARTKPRTITVKAKSKPAVNSVEPEPLPEAWQLPPATKEECIDRIRTLGHRVEAYVRFMKAIENVPGTSAESRQKALTAFYERMLFFDRELGRIQEDLQLG